MSEPATAMSGRRPDAPTGDAPTGDAGNGRAALGSGAFRTVAIALAVFVLLASAGTHVLFRQTDAALTAEVLDALKADAAVIAREHEVGGRAALERAIEARIAAAPLRLYLLADVAGRKLAGNLDGLPPELAGTVGGVFSYTRDRRGPAPADADRSYRSTHATNEAAAVIVALPDATRLLVGRDIEREKALISRLRIAALMIMGTLAVTGLAGGYWLSRQVLARVEAVNETARQIMAGDMGRRIPLAGRDDEIDALAGNLNGMLDRIEQLMNGLREVSDNIAHDLKTPLNRLRNRAEAALRETSDPQVHRAGLERTIEDADELIKTFNALLLIARLEAGALEGETEDVDLAALAGDVVELYAPVAEEAGITLSLATADDVRGVANRHLVGQAVANLIDNAIKYGTTPGHARDGKGMTPRRATRVVVLVRRDGPSATEISVSDDGPGIDAQDRARVLKRFVRLEQSRSRPGTGLGLSLVSAVARLHGGGLRLEDAAPGLRAVLTLPARDARRKA